MNDAAPISLARDNQVALILAQHAQSRAEDPAIAAPAWPCTLAEHRHPDMTVAATLAARTGGIGVPIIRLLIAQASAAVRVRCISARLIGASAVALVHHGSMLYELIPNMPASCLRPLIKRFAERPAGQSSRRLFRYSLT